MVCMDAKWYPRILQFLHAFEDVFLVICAAVIIPVAPAHTERVFHLPFQQHFLKIFCACFSQKSAADCAKYTFRSVRTIFPLGEIRPLKLAENRDIGPVFERSADELIKIIFQVAELDNDGGLSQRVDISQAPIRNSLLQRMVAHVSPNRPLHSEYVFSQFIYSRTLANKTDSPGEMSSSLVFSTLKRTVKLSLSLTNCVQIPFGYPIIPKCSKMPR